jgi:hypothetical protein
VAIKHLRLIAACQIAGGAYIIIGSVAAATQISGGFAAAKIVPGLIIAVLAIVAGFVLWKAPRRGARVSIGVQAFQLAYVTTPSFVIGSTLGPTIGPRLTAETITLNVGFSGRAALYFAPTGMSARQFDLTVNLLAIVALVVLVRALRSEAATA